MEQQPAILIYIPRVTNRHKYITSVIFEQLGLSFRIVSELPDPGTTGLNYSHTHIAGWHQLVPAGLVEMKGITGISTQVLDWEDTPCLFPVNKASLLPFDIFSAAFYCLSRYEEYLPFKPDEHGRFPHTATWQHRHGCLHRPLIEIWVTLLASALQKAMPGLVVRKNNPRQMLTMDVDEPFKIYGRPLFKKLGTGIKSSLLHPRRTGTYFNASGQPQKDPYHTFPMFREMAEETGQRPRVFFLLNNKGKYNTRANYRNPQLKQLIKDTSAWAEVGIHTSYLAASDGEMIYKEKTQLEQILNRPVVSARQHFLKFTLPAYYKYLLQAEFTGDYSMGFSAVPGYRAGTSRPFYWYDLESEDTTELLVYPFAWMDATFTYYQKRKKEEEIILTLNNLYEEAFKYGGNMTALLHNDHLSGERGFKNWSKIIKALKTVDK